jgi:predicted DNA-binding protein
VKKISKQGVRAPDQTVLSIPMSKKMKAELQKLAVANDRKTADFVRLVLNAFIEQSKRYIAEKEEAEKAPKKAPLSDSPNYTSQASQASHSRRSASG